MCAPVLEQRAAEHGGALKIVKLTVDENPQTPAALGIRGIPTLMLFKDGELAATQVGAAAKSQLAAFVAPHLAVACSNERTSAERRVGTACVSTCRSRWSPYHSK